MIIISDPEQSPPSSRLPSAFHGRVYGRPIIGHLVGLLHLATTSDVPFSISRDKRETTIQGSGRAAFIYGLLLPCEVTLLVFSYESLSITVERDQ
jgi:hypothetical protein